MRDKDLLFATIDAWPIRMASRLERPDQSACGDVYESDIENFIKDIRKDLAIEKLPFVIANTGMEG